MEKGLEDLLHSKQSRRIYRRKLEEWRDVHFPNSERITVVLDNLNIHRPSLFYEAFEPKGAHRLVERFEFHYTPKHGSWLNMVEIED